MGPYLCGLLCMVNFHSDSLIWAFQIAVCLFVDLQYPSSLELSLDSSRTIMQAKLPQIAVRYEIMVWSVTAITSVLIVWKTQHTSTRFSKFNNWKTTFNLCLFSLWILPGKHLILCWNPFSIENLRLKVNQRVNENNPLFSLKFLHISALNLMTLFRWYPLFVSQDLWTQLLQSAIDHNMQPIISSSWRCWRRVVLDKKLSTGRQMRGPSWIHYSSRHW